jgi:TRAP-type mannitol/chloroaromatic compound transport system permease large subunit
MMQAAVPNMQMGDLYRGVIWFIVIDIISMALFIAYPQLILWLPGMMMN